MNTIYDVDYFLKKFEAIAEELWCVGSFTQKRNGITTHCALGHCEYSMDVDRRESEWHALYDLFNQTLKINPDFINDGESALYPQPTAKQRILAALRDIKAKQQPAPVVVEQPKVIYKTVVIDTPVKELTDKELCQQ